MQICNMLNLQQTMQSGALCVGPSLARSPLLRPVCQRRIEPFRCRHNCGQKHLQWHSRVRHTCSASDESRDSQVSSQDEVRPEISKTKLSDKGADTEVPKLGLAGTIVTWALLLVSTHDQLELFEKAKAPAQP